MNDILDVNIDSMRYPGPKSSSNTIENLCFSATIGSFISFLGPSGAGKTTLLRIIAGLERRYEGHVRLGNDAVVAPNRRIQIVFQDYRLLPWKTAAENVEFAL